MGKSRNITLHISEAVLAMVDRAASAPIDDSGDLSLAVKELISDTSEWDESQPIEGKGFLNLPVSPATNFMGQVLTSGENLEALPKRHKATTKSSTIEVMLGEPKNPLKRGVTFNSANSSITVELEDISKLSSKKKPAKKLFVLSLVKIGKAYDYAGGQLYHNSIEIPLQELVTLGAYGNTDSARKGCIAGADTLTSMKVKGELRAKGGGKSGQKAAIVNAVEVLFTGYRIDKGVCTLYLNERIDWSFIARYYTIMPEYAFALSSRAFDLITSIFYLARQRHKDIADNGYFTVSMREVQKILYLPDEEGNTNPKSTIKDPIEEAIEEIETAADSTDFTITPSVDSSAPIKEYLNGYLKIELKGNYAKRFIALSDDQRKQIKAAENRREKAKAIAMAKKLEADTSAATDKEQSLDYR